MAANAALSPGQKVQLQMGERSFKGLVFCYDEESDVLVLEEPREHSTIKQDVRIIKPSLLDKVEVLAEAEEGAPVDLPEITQELVLEREKAGVEAIIAQRRRLGKGVSPQGQKIFDELSKTYNCQWKGKSIVSQTLGLLIEPPYQPENVKGRDPTALDRIKKIVQILNQRIEQGQI